MKRIIIIIGLSLALFSCSKDEKEQELEQEPVTCSVSDFEAVWKITGGKGCIIDKTNTLTIVDIGNNKLQCTFTGNGFTIIFEDWIVNGCVFIGKLVDAASAQDITVTGTFKDGKLTITYKGTILGMTFDCTENLTK